MTRLSFDKTRCAGRRDFTPETEICPMRNACMRYLTVVVGDYGPHTPMQLWCCELPRFDMRIAPPDAAAESDAQAVAAWHEVVGSLLGPRAGAQASADQSTQGSPDVNDNNTHAVRSW